MRKKIMVRAVAALAGAWAVLSIAGMAGAAQTAIVRTEEWHATSHRRREHGLYLWLIGHPVTLLQHLAYILYAEATAQSQTPIQIIYQSQASCVGVLGRHDVHGVT